MKELTAEGALRKALTADNWWGIAAFLWISTGLWRLLGSLEKSTGYYMHSRAFYVKMALFGLVFLLELWPMMTLIRWRAAQRKGTLPPVAELAPIGKRIARISDVQTLLLLGIVIAAVMMARGYGA